MLPILWLVLSVVSCGGETVLPGKHTVFHVSLPTRPHHWDNAAIRLITKSMTKSTIQFTPQGVVFFSTVFQGNLNTWSVNVTGGPEDVTEKTLCFDPFSRPKTRADYLSVVAYSELSYEQTFTIQAEWDTKFLLTAASSPRLLNVTDSSPQVVQFVTDSPGSRYLVMVESQVNEEKCMFVGINPPGCPWENSLASVTSSKLWSRMLKIGYFTIKSEDFPQSFTVSLISLHNSSDCFRERTAPNDEKTFKTVKISFQKLETNYLKPFLISIFSILVTSVIFFGVWVYCWYCQLHYNNKMIEQRRSLNIHNGHSPVQTETQLLDVSTTSLSPDNIVRRNLCQHVEESHAGNPSLKTKCFVHRLLQGKLTVADTCLLIRENSYHRRQRSKVYLYLVPLLALFYLVPSVQMVLAEQRRARDTGDMEMCYLNYGCSRQWASFEDINHIVSNGGYIIYGVAFILLVRLKAAFLPEENRTNTDHLGRIGLPQQHSIFYTLGICMVMQGVFSAIFHTCPSNISLQFDTTMMYVMLILTFIKIYQFRHPDISFNAYNCMYSFVTILMLEAVSLYVSTFSYKMIFYVVFAILYASSAAFLLLDCYFYGALQAGFSTNISVFIKESFSTHFVYPKRLALTVVFTVLNLGLLALTLYRSVQDGAKGLSTPILIILASNVGIFLIHYMVRKIVENCRTHEGEFTRRRWLMRFFSFLFFLFALVLGLAAGYFYTNRHQSRNSSPQESRNLNKPCEYMNFFDNHDIWHFLSATALFLAFIFLLTIDDDLLLTDRDKIVVF